MRDHVAEAEQKISEPDASDPRTGKKLRDESGRSSSPQNLMNAVSQLDEEHMRLEIEQAAKTARRTALTKALADSKKEVEECVKEDPVVAELEKIVEIRADGAERKRRDGRAGYRVEGRSQRRRGATIHRPSTIAGTTPAGRPNAGADMFQ